MGKLLNISELCEKLGVSRRTIYYWLETGKLSQPAKRWGSPRWDEDQISRDLKRQNRDSCAKT